jgi:hypothetical protein
MNQAIIISPPKNKAGALMRMGTLIAGEAIVQGEHLTDPVTRTKALGPHWMFRVCRDEAVKYRWPLKNGNLTWTSGDTVQKFLDQLDLPD